MGAEPSGVITPQPGVQRGGSSCCFWSALTPPSGCGFHGSMAAPVGWLAEVGIVTHLLGMWTYCTAKTSAVVLGGGVGGGMSVRHLYHSSSRVQRRWNNDQSANMRPPQLLLWRLCVGRRSSSAGSRSVWPAPASPLIIAALVRFEGSASAGSPLLLRSILHCSCQINGLLILFSTFPFVFPKFPSARIANRFFLLPKPGFCHLETQR